jgi:hypothetical protein
VHATYICYQKQQFVKHLFTDCKATKEIREYVHDETQRYMSTSDKYRRWDFILILNKRQPIQWRQLELTTNLICYMERGRYTKIFRKRGKEARHVEIVREILYEYREWFRN